MMQRTNSGNKECVTLPFPPLETQGTQTDFGMDVYVRFMRHLRIIPCSKYEIRILSAIQFVADSMNEDDAQIAKILVDLGLRAPRMAFPESFLEFIDYRIMRGCTNDGSSLYQLIDHWNGIGEDPFAAACRDIPFAIEQIKLF